jgi:hypothetical protein
LAPAFSLLAGTRFLVRQLLQRRVSTTSGWLWLVCGEKDSWQRPHLAVIAIRWSGIRFLVPQWGQVQICVSVIAPPENSGHPNLDDNNNFSGPVNES